MRVALFSDVHSNLHALEAVLEHLEEEDVDRVYCLGDIVGYNAFPVECTRLVRDACDAVILGNHDWASTEGSPDGFNLAARAGVDYTRRQLTDAEYKYLTSLVPQMRERLDGMELALYHGSPVDPLWQYVFPPSAPSLFMDLARHLDDDAPRVIALGHTHVPMLLTAKDVEANSVGDFPDALVQSNLESDRQRDLVLVNPGSVGQPRDGDPRASYAILDTTDLNVHFHRVQYDVHGAARAIREAGLPDVLAERLFIGR